jgi:hypothetical protein
MPRREFLRTASLIPAALLDPEFVLANRSFRPTVPKFVPLRPLAAGAVSAAQAEQLGGHLPEVSSPFDGVYWSGEEWPAYGREDGRWPSEQKGYWIDGMMRFALVLATIEGKQITVDPWLEPPVVLNVSMKAVSGWTLHAADAHPDRLQTPALPEVVSAENAPATRVTLVPYGSTHLRLTIFPSAS